MVRRKIEDQKKQNELQKDWSEYANTQNKITLDNFQDLTKYDLDYDLMTTYNL